MPARDEAVAEAALGRGGGVGEQRAQRGGAVLGEADDAAAGDEDAAVAVDADARVEREPQSDEAAVERVVAARRAAALRAREPGDQRGDLLRLEQPAERLLGGEGLGGLEAVEARALVEDRRCGSSRG